MDLGEHAAPGERLDGGVGLGDGRSDMVGAPVGMGVTQSATVVLAPPLPHSSEVESSVMVHEICAFLEAILAALPPPAEPTANVKQRSSPGVPREMGRHAVPVDPPVSVPVVEVLVSSSVHV